MSYTNGGHCRGCWSQPKGDTLSHLHYSANNTPSNWAESTKDHFTTRQHHRHVQKEK